MSIKDIFFYIYINLYIFIYVDLEIFAGAVAAVAADMEAD